MIILNAEVSNINLTIKFNELIVGVILKQYGVVAFPLKNYENVIKFLKIFPEGLSGTKYIRVAMDKDPRICGYGNVMGICHIVNDDSFYVLEEADPTDPSDLLGEDLPPIAEEYSSAFFEELRKKNPPVVHNDRL